MFYLGQLLGVIALILLAISFQKNDKKQLLKYQIFSSLLFGLQYLCLNGISGCLMNIMTTIRNCIFNRYEKKVPIYWLLIVLACMGILSAVSYENLYSLLPTIAVMAYSVAVWQDNLTITRIVELFSCSLFVIYNIKYVAIAGLISTLLEMSFAGIAIYRLDIKKEKDVKKQPENDR